MKIEDRFSLDGVTITVRNTMRQEIRWRTMLSAFPVGDPEAPEADARTQFFYINAHTVAVKGGGLKWKPSEKLDAEALEASYQAYLDTVPRQLSDLWLSKVLALREPIADLIERPDETLTAEQAADPNS